MIWRTTVACILACAVVVSTPPLRGQATTPRLLVILVVDQMRADYLDELQHHWSSGFRTLLTEGAVFERALYPYLTTVTCAGNATISTGVFPRTHGIIANAWWDRDRAMLIDCSIDHDPAAAHVSYGAGALSGNGPHLLKAQALGDQLRRERPGSRVVALSLKPDTSVMLAGHGGDVVTWFDGLAGSFVTSGAYSKGPHPAVADFIAANPLSNDLQATWTLLRPPDTYLHADATPGQRPPAGRDGLFPHAISGPKGPDARSIALWQQSPLSDRYLARMAAALIDQIELGRDDTPDLLAVGFSALDLVGHAFGPDSREVEDVLVNLDRTVGELLEVLDRRIGRQAYVLALTADHGVAPIPQPSMGGRLITADLEERVEELLRAKWGAAQSGSYATVGSGYVYFASGVMQRIREDRALWRAVVRAIDDVPGVARVLAADELSPRSDDSSIRAAALSYVPDRSGDLVVLPEPGWFFIGRNSTAATTHGTLYEYDRHVPLILFGGGIRSVRLTQTATPADIAPTLASLVGILLRGAEGRVLREAMN